ncbi:hypothetical protein HK104_009126 [Borealophlyctis nickersoniae]|nr:hypothetical protein HK104_009126 [Borealophlyctis nickersoniae]
MLRRHATGRLLAVSGVCRNAQVVRNEITWNWSCNAVFPQPSRIPVPTQRGITDIVTRKATGELYLKSGPGGRSSVSGYTATVFGSTGFLGRYLVNNLGKQGTQVVVSYRGLDDERRHLKQMGDLGQIVPLRFDLRNEQQIAENVRHSDVVYNLMARDYPTKNFTFEQVNVDGARRVARICREQGVSKLIHISALNADENSPSHFLRTKALGEKAVREEFPDAIIVRPASMYGQEDRFWNRIGWFIKWIHVLPLFNHGRTRMRPVYVGDVAEVLARLMKDEKLVGKTVELYGPSEYYYKYIMELFLDVTRRRTPTVWVPKSLMKFSSAVMTKFMAQPLFATPDEIERLYVSDTPTPDSITFDYFNIKPHSIEETVARFAGVYREGTKQLLPYNPILKKYSAEFRKM